MPPNNRKVPALGWRLQIASDLVADGMGLELYDADDTLQAELFRSDREHRVVLTTYRDLPSELIEWVEAEGARILGPFEDGTPLPGPSEWGRSAA